MASNAFRLAFPASTTSHGYGLGSTGVIQHGSANANQAITISIVQPSDDRSLHTLSGFQPEFTYPLFGEAELVFGYQNLRIKLRYTAHDLRPNFQIQYNKKYQPVGDTKATDVRGILQNCLSDGTVFTKHARNINKPLMFIDAFEEPGDYDTRILDNPANSDWKPPGQLAHTYNVGARTYEIWCGELTDPAIQRLVDRMQLLVSFFVEGATFLALDEEDWTLSRWRVYFIYETFSPGSAPTAPPYSIVGYSTSYRFLTYVPSHGSKQADRTFTLPPSSPIHPSSLPCRSRISQFLILPPHQNQGHGAQLYNTMTKHFLDDPSCVEITVEDPNESFDDLRDYCDYARLSTNGTFAKIKLNNNHPKSLTANRVGVHVPTGKLLNVPLLETLRKENKLAPRQFYRLVELNLFSRFSPRVRQSGYARLRKRGAEPDPELRGYYYWRLLVKQRIYKKNKDVLMQLDRRERIEKVEETVGEVAGDYERLWRGIAGGKGRSDKPAKQNTNGGSSSQNGNTEPGEMTVRSKRKIVNEDEDDNDEGEGKERAPKKPKNGDSGEG